MMQEEIIPPLKAALEAEEDVSQVQLAFENNTVSSQPLVSAYSISLLSIVWETRSRSLPQISRQISDRYSAHGLQLEGSFIKDDVPYCFWAFFPKGDLTGAYCYNFFLSLDFDDLKLLIS
jgi:hypothetical protein